MTHIKWKHHRKKKKKKSDDSELNDNKHSPNIVIS
jgi:hypothetical protein